MLRIVDRCSRKYIFITLIAFCLLGICITYLADIKVITSAFSNVMLSRYTQRKLFLDTNLTETPNHNNMSIEGEIQTVKKSIKSTSGYLHKQQNGDVDDTGHSFKNNSIPTISSLQITKANNISTTITPEVFPTTTTMTFNNTLFVRCKESPYIECFPPNLKHSPGKIFKITYLRRPVWIHNSDMDMSGCRFSHAHSVCVFNESHVTNDTDIVVIDGVYLKDTFQVRQRWPHQLYVIHFWEPPFMILSDYIKKSSSPWNNQINMIMSYRLDSDIFVPYNRLKFNPKPVDQRPNYYEIAKTKTRTAVWVVSHCKTFSKREKYVKEMQKYIDIDIFGKCGIPCKSKRKSCHTWTTKYKFYLAFENSLCTDYVTEKFFKIFDRSIYMIPVVRGGADYDRHFPNFTYINSAHFKTPKDLALHLKHLASDLETYSKYLDYKDLYTSIPEDNINNIMACKLCTYLHTQKLPETTRIYNLTQRLVDGQCHNAEDF